MHSRYAAIVESLTRSRCKDRLRPDAHRGLSLSQKRVIVRQSAGPALSASRWALTEPQPKVNAPVSLVAMKTPNANLVPAGKLWRQWCCSTSALATWNGTGLTSRWWSAGVGVAPPLCPLDGGPCPCYTSGAHAVVSSAASSSRA